MQRFSFYPYILGLLVSCFVSLSTAEAANFCDIMLTKLPDSVASVINQYKVDFENSSFYRSANGYSVEIQPIYDGRFYVLNKKEGMPWFSKDFSEVGYSNGLQGDPRWNFAVFGEETLKHFRIVSYGKDQIVYPSVDEFNKKLDKLNTKLIELGYPEISIQFYSQKVGTMDVYLDKFTNDFAIPIANPEKSPMHYVHDMSFHIGAILIHEKYMKMFLMRTQLIYDFVKYYEELNKYSETAKIYTRRTKQMLTGQVDVATANISVLAAKARESLKHRDYADYGPDAQLFMSNRIISSFQGLNDIENEFIPADLNISSEAVRGLVSRFMLRPDIQEKYSEYFATRADYFRSFRERSFLSELVERRAQIEEAAAELNP